MPLPANRVEAIAKVVFAAHFALEHPGDKIPSWDKVGEDERNELTDKIDEVANAFHANEAFLHNAWAAKQEKENWKFGKVYDETKKTDPLLVGFGKLPYDIQTKHRLLVNIVRSMQRV